MAYGPSMSSKACSEGRTISRAWSDQSAARPVSRKDFRALRNHSTTKVPVPVAGSIIDTNGLSWSTPSGIAKPCRCPTSAQVAPSAIPAANPNRFRRMESTVRVMNSTTGWGV